MTTKFVAVKLNGSFSKRDVNIDINNMSTLPSLFNIKFEISANINCIFFDSEIICIVVYLYISGIQL